MIEKASSWESFQQNSDSWEEAVRAELTSHQGNRKGMRLVHYSVPGVLVINARIGRTKVCSSYEHLPWK